MGTGLHHALLQRSPQKGTYETKNKKSVKIDAGIKNG